jgi:uncharacterized protein YceK
LSVFRWDFLQQRRIATENGQRATSGFVAFVRRAVRRADHAVEFLPWRLRGQVGEAGMQPATTTERKEQNMNWIKRRIVLLCLTAVLTMMSVGGADVASADGFNDEYVYATTRGVSDMDAHPGLKITLYPVTLVVDTAFLPFAVIAGFVTG